MRSSIAIVLALAGCFAEVQSSTHVLGAASSAAELRAPPLEVARTLTKLFATRGYSLVDQQRDGAMLVLRLKGNREVTSLGKGATQFGSLFEVRIASAGPGSRVTMLGVPIIDGRVACTTEHTVLPCEVVDLPDGLQRDVDGSAEADVVHGVFSELALDQPSEIGQ